MSTLSLVVLVGLAACVGLFVYVLLRRGATSAAVDPLAEDRALAVKALQRFHAADDPRRELLAVAVFPEGPQRVARGVAAFGTLRAWAAAAGFDGDGVERAQAFLSAASATGAVDLEALYTMIDQQQTRRGDPWV